VKTPFAPFEDLSLRWKIPLRVMLAVLGTALAVTAALTAREYDALRQNLQGHASSMGRVLAHTLVVPVQHDDIWRAFEILKSAHAPNPAAPELQAQVVLVTDAEFRVIASTRPMQFPVGASAAAQGPAYGMLRAELSRGEPGAQRIVEVKDSPTYFVMTPLLLDGVVLGQVILGYSKVDFVPRFIGLVGRAALVTVLVLAVLLPISWVWAGRTARPLLELAGAMRQVPIELEAAQLDKLPRSRDEIGQLTAAFGRMLAQLRDKQALEEQMLTSERLAAIGRLSAGIAHEINNPLGGMLTAINTYQRHGSSDALATSTLSLLERGLTQIRNTVAALLVETRTEDRPFGPADIDDLLILIKPECSARGVRMVLDATLAKSVELPSTLVRQVLLNLLLNAVAAAGPQGVVRLSATSAPRMLTLAVCNNGRHIAQEEMPYLFEPFFSHTVAGHGLGLWMVYQITKQLGGDIAVESEPGLTTFTVEMPHAGSASASEPAQRTLVSH
jgi:signal transduction histidine kinase